MDRSACLNGTHMTDGWNATEKALPDQFRQSVSSVQSNGHPARGSENPGNSNKSKRKKAEPDSDPFASIPNASERSDAVL